jgi:multiple sugar transport system permease protein
MFGTDWPALMGGAVISLLPILLIFFFAQRYFVQGITLTGLKG